LKKKHIAEKKTTADKCDAAKKRCKQCVSYQEACNAAAERLEEEAIKLHAEFGSWYKEDILQLDHLKTESQGVSHWNVFVRAEAKRINGGNSKNPLKVHEISSSIKKKWKLMSEEEKIAVTDPLLKGLKEHRDSISYGQWNVNLELFMDAKQSLVLIQQYISAFHAHTGTQMLLLASRGSADLFLHPFSMWTSDHMLDFPFHQFKQTLAKVSSKFKAYCLSGIEGMVNRYTSTTNKLRSRVKNIINESIVSKVQIVYMEFHDKITVLYGIIIEHWPIDCFRSPSELTQAEVNVLLGA
ncbi:hypothetical protein C0992_007149, partial [Termitomyces sp. T32_za158]